MLENQTIANLRIMDNPKKLQRICLGLRMSSVSTRADPVACILLCQTQIGSKIAAINTPRASFMQKTLHTGYTFTRIIENFIFKGQEPLV